MTRSTLRLCIDAVEVLGPGLPDWTASRPILAGQAPYQPQPVVLQPPPQLSPAERRRTVPSVRLALAVGSAATARSGHDPDGLLAVFASSGADGDTIGAILAALNTPTREVSPTRFHNSVHNAPSGYWSIATHSREASTSISCHDFTFAAGLLEAGVQAVAHERPVLLVAYDLPYPSPLHEVRPIGGIFGVAMVVSPAPLSGCQAHLDLSFVESSPTGLDTCEDDGLEQLRLGNPAARALPLLSRLAREDVAREARGGNVARGAREGDVVPGAREGDVVRDARESDIVRGAREGNFVRDAREGNVVRGARESEIVRMELFRGVLEARVHAG